MTLTAREKLERYGADELSNNELLALVVGGKTPKDTARELLEKYDLIGLFTALPNEVAKIEGIGKTKAASICAAFAIARRAQQAELPYATPLRQPSDVFNYCKAKLGHLTQEVFVILGLDARQRVRFVRTVGMGSLAHVDVHPREVFRPLVRAGMHAVILVHNHPSSDVDVSDADIELTNRLVEAGRLMGIPVLDSLVVTKDESLSFSAVGLMPDPRL